MTVLTIVLVKTILVDARAGAIVDAARTSFLTSNDATFTSSSSMSLRRQCCKNRDPLVSRLPAPSRPDEGGTVVWTHDLRYLATGSTPFDFICSKKCWKLNVRRRRLVLSASIAKLFGILGADRGVSGRFYRGGLVDRDLTEDGFPCREIGDERLRGEGVVGWGIGCTGS